MEKKTKKLLVQNDTRSKSERPKAKQSSTIISRCAPAPDGFRYRWIEQRVLDFKTPKT